MEKWDEQTPSRGLFDIVKDLRREATLLLRDEMELARAEMMEKTGAYRKGTMNIAIGGAVAYAGFLVFLAGLGFLLYRGFIEMDMAPVMAMWVAPLVLGAVVLIIGGIMVRSSMRNLKNETLVPEKTLDTLKEDKQWAQQKVA